MVLVDLTVAPDFRTELGLVQNIGVVQTLGLPVLNRAPDLKSVGAADHFVDGAKAELGHEFAHLLGDEAHEVDRIAWIAHEFFAQDRVLGGHADRAGVEVADPHHDAAQGDQGGGRKAVLLRTQQGRHHNVTAGFELAVGFDHNAAAQVVQDQGLMSLGHAQLPGQAGVFDAGLGRGAGAAVMAADQHHIGVALGHPGGNCADPDFGDKLDTDPGVVVGVLEIVDQLGQILNRIDIVVGRWRDESHAGCGQPDFGNPGVDLAAR